MAVERGNREARPSILAGVIPSALLLVLAAVFFALLAAWISAEYYNFANARFPSVGESAWRAGLWGIVSRAQWLVLCVPLLIWRPRLFGWQWGRTREHWRMLAIMMTVNCGVIAAYLWLTGSSTPYSGNQWLLTEVVTVPVIEEIVWRGIVFTALLLLSRRFFGENVSQHLTVWLSGLAFGLVHVVNGLAGVPLAFVAIQTLNAMVWGVMYGYARSKTDSLIAPLLLHAAMNLVVVSF